MKTDCIDLKAAFGDRYRIKLDPAASPRSRDPWDYIIHCKHGEIYPHGGEHLAAMVTAIRVANQMRRWPELEVIQDADDAVVFRFCVEHFERVADRIGARKRRQYSPETLERMRRRAESARNSLRKANRERVQEPESGSSRLEAHPGLPRRIQLQNTGDFAQEMGDCKKQRPINDDHGTTS